MFLFIKPSRRRPEVIRLYEFYLLLRGFADDEEYAFLTLTLLFRCNKPITLRTCLGTQLRCLSPFDSSGMFLFIKPSRKLPEATRLYEFYLLLRGLADDDGICIF